MSQIKNKSYFRVVSDAALMLLVVVLAVTGITLTGLQAQPDVNSISDLPLADPTIDSDAQFHAMRTSVWYDGVVQYMFLKRDVTIAVGTYGFRADTAVIRIQRQATSTGQEVRHMWMYLDNAQAMPGRGPTSATAPRLLVTVSTTGKVDLTTDLMEKVDRSGEDLTADAKRRFISHFAAISRPVVDTTINESADAKAARMARENVVTNGGPTIVMDKQVDTALPQSPFSAVDPKASVTRPQLPGVSAMPSTSTVDTTTAKTPSESVAVEPVKPVAPVSTQTSAKPDEPQPVVPTQTTGPMPVDLTAAVTTAVESTPVVNTVAQNTSSILPPAGTVSLTFDEMIVDLGQEQPYAVLMGKVGVMYVDEKGQLAMSLRADQAVIFLRKQDKEYQQVFSKLDAADVVGVYLEDNVQVTNGDYNVRAPRAYYDTTKNKAVVLDAVMYTWNVRKKVPLYVRAEKIMQMSQTQWQASNAKLTTSEFAEPHFAIAARTITLTQIQDKNGESDYRYSANDVGLTWGSAKLFGGGHMGGRLQEIPLRSVAMSYSGNNGPTVQSTWDTFMLLGRDRPEGVQSTTSIDYLGRHGVGLGLDLDYDKPNMEGLHKGYALLHDDGEDEIGGRDEIGHDGDFRGFYRGQHRSFLENGWELSLEMGYASDETFLEELFVQEVENEKPYETSLYLLKQQDQTSMSFYANYELNEFTMNSAQLQYQGYTVEKLPEVGFHSVGESLFDNHMTYYGQTTASYMRVQPGEDTPADRGFTNAQSLLLFGQANTVSFENAYNATNAPEGFVMRLDSRHEIQAPMKLGSVDLVPYAVGRATVYDDDFNAYNGNDENVRLWGSAGLRAHTQFNKTISNLDSRLFDLHNIRHIIEPSVDVSFSGTSIEATDLPIFDYDVEGLRDGTTVSVGLRNTFQTQRGGPGRWRSVDWLIVDSHYVVSSDDAEPNPNVLAHYFGYRPEDTRGGEYFHTSVAWMISDSLASMSEFTYDFDQDKLTQWRTGLTLEHSPVLATFVDYQEIDTLDTRLLTYGFSYRITSKYFMTFAHRMDFSSGGDDQRSIDVTLVRELPRWHLIGLYSLDETDGDQTFGIMLMPLGLGGSKYGRPLYGAALR